MTTAPWRDPALPAEARVDDLLARMTLEEKTAQLYGVWVGAATDGDGVAPNQAEMTSGFDWDELITHGLGQLTRSFGTAPVDPALGAQALARAQRRIAEAGRFGIPAVAHEECLAGFTAWGATAYPVPLAWGATFDPDLVEEMARRIGQDLRLRRRPPGPGPRPGRRTRPALGPRRGDHRRGPVPGRHDRRGLRPRPGVRRDHRHAQALRRVRVLGGRPQPRPRAGGCTRVRRRHPAAVRVRAARGRGPLGDGRVHGHGRRARLLGPVPADRTPAGAVGVHRHGRRPTTSASASCETLHRVAGTKAEAAHAALAAGIDVELPTLRCYGDPLVEAVRAGDIPESLVDRAATRVLRQKCELGLLDEDWTPEPTGPIDLDSTANRALARRLAEESVVLLSNPDGLLPLAPDTRIAVVGPRAADALAMLGCYSFPSHVGTNHPELPMGIEIPTLLESLRTELPDAKVTFTEGCDTTDPDTSGFAEAVARSAEADVCVAVLGDRAGLFGRGTSGEGCDVGRPPTPGRTGPVAGHAWPPPAPPSYWSCSPAARTRWAAGTASWPPPSRRSSRGRRAARQWQECCRAASTPRAGSR